MEGEKKKKEKNPHVFQTSITPALENSIKASCVKGVSKGRPLDVKMGDEKASPIPRDADRTRGDGAASLSGSLVRACVKSICHVDTRSHAHISFPTEKSPVPARPQDENEHGHPWAVFFSSN